MPDRPELGIYLKQAAPMITLVKRFWVNHHRLIDADQCLPRPGRVTVYISNHGPMFAPLPAPALTVDHLLSLGGYDQFVAITLFHNVVEWVPGVSLMLRKTFGHSTTRLRSMSDLIEMMKQRRFNIIGTTPEGSSSAFCYDEPVGAFTRPGLMIAALESEADIVLAAQKGVEVFGMPVRFPADLTLPMPERPRGLMFPRWYPGLKADVTVAYRRFEPATTPARRDAMGERGRREALSDEMIRIRAELLDLYHSIP